MKDKTTYNTAGVLNSKKFNAGGLMIIGGCIISLIGANLLALSMKTIKPKDNCSIVIDFRDKNIMKRI